MLGRRLGRLSRPSLPMANSQPYLPARATRAGSAPTAPPNAGAPTNTEKLIRPVGRFTAVHPPARATRAVYEQTTPSHAGAEHDVKPAPDGVQLTN